MPEPRGNLQKYRSGNPLQKFLIRKFLQKVRSRILAIPKGKLCDAGCGEGFALRDLRDNGALEGFSVTGVDLDDQALTFAKGSVPEAVFKKASAYELPFGDKEFRIVMMLEVLEHLEFPEKALKEAARTGEYLILSVPHEPWFRAANFLRGKNWSRWGNDPEHINAWGQRSFRKMIEPYGTLLSLDMPFPWLLAVLKTTGGG